MGHTPKLPFDILDYHKTGPNFPFGMLHTIGDKTYMLVKASAALTCRAGYCLDFSTRKNATVVAAGGSGSKLCAGFCPSGSATRTAAAGDAFWLLRKGVMTVYMGSAGTDIAAGLPIREDSVLGKVQGLAISVASAGALLPAFGSIIGMGLSTVATAAACTCSINIIN